MSVVDITREDWVQETERLCPSSLAFNAYVELEEMIVADTDLASPTSVYLVESPLTAPSRQTLELSCMSFKSTRANVSCTCESTQS